MSEKFVPLHPAETEIVIDNSRFIAEAAPAGSVEEARAFIQKIKNKYPDASHHVPAFVIGHGNSTITHCHDDGEPSGTAGRPALTVLSTSGLGNVVVVVTRYFGGIKLGTGGLVKAYTNAVIEVLKVLPRGKLVSTRTLMAVLPYASYERAKLLAGRFNATIKDQEFDLDVSLTISLLETDADDFVAQLIDLTNGQVVIDTIAANVESVVSL